jgi:hypothetical protein
MLSLALLPFESALAVDVPLKKSDPGGIGPMMLSRSLTTTVVTASLNEPELVVDFSRPVGTATISILDEFGSVIYQESIDTYSNLETVIDTSVFDSGNYTLKISYGTTNLKGTFQL